MRDVLGDRTGMDETVVWRTRSTPHTENRMHTPHREHECTPRTLRAIGVLMYEVDYIAATLTDVREEGAALGDGEAVFGAIGELLLGYGLADDAVQARALCDSLAAALAGADEATAPTEAPRLLGGPTSIAAIATDVVAVCVVY